MDLPDADVVEITVLGPGVGESQIVHLGNGEWIVIDSFLRARTKDPAPLAYLRHRGVDLSQVRHVIATHWHDDHVAGISDVLKSCPRAIFTTWMKFNDHRFRDALKRDQKAHSDIERTMDELGKCFRESARRSKLHKQRFIKYAGPDQTIARVLVSSQRVELQSLSPRDGDFDRGLAILADWSPPRDMRRRRPGDDNATSVATLLDAVSFSAILGADLEGNSNHEWGWGAVLADSTLRPEPKASFWKVPHHGSPTGHHEAFINGWLESPVSVIAPYARGRKRLPGQRDVERVGDYSESASVVSTGSVRIKANGRLADVLRSAKSKALLPGGDDGLLVARRRLGDEAWVITTDGSTKTFRTTR